MPPRLVLLVQFRIKKYALVGHILRSIPIRCLRHVTTLVMFCKCDACSRTSGQKLVFRLVEIRATEWAFERVREAFEKVATDEAGILNIVQGIMLQNTDFLQRIIAPAGGQGGVTMSFLSPHIATVFLWRTTCGGFQLGRSTAAGGAQSVEKMN